MNFPELREQLLSQTRERIAASISPDILIIQQLAAIDDITGQVNNLVGRLREWHGYFLPEVGHYISDNELFAQTVANNTFKDLYAQHVKDKVSMGSSDEALYDEVRGFAKLVYDQYVMRKTFLDALEASMKKFIPNVQLLAGTTIGARLLAEAGSLRNLALMPASTVQLLGAEKALFRHLKSGSRSPKHGHIFNHQLIQQAKKSDRGKVARALGDKLCMCAKLDFFKGEIKGHEYLSDLQTKFGRSN
jgi:nucleolar protein 56